MGNKVIKSRQKLITNDTNPATKVQDDGVYPYSNSSNCLQLEHPADSVLKPQEVLRVVVLPPSKGDEIPVAIPVKNPVNERDFESCFPLPNFMKKKSSKDLETSRVSSLAATKLAVIPKYQTMYVYDENDKFMEPTIPEKKKQKWKSRVWNKLKSSKKCCNPTNAIRNLFKKKNQNVVCDSQQATSVPAPLPVITKPTDSQTLRIKGVDIASINLIPENVPVKNLPTESEHEFNPEAFTSIENVESYLCDCEDCPRRKAICAEIKRSKFDLNSTKESLKNVSSLERILFAYSSYDETVEFESFMVEIASKCIDLYPSNENRSFTAFIHWMNSKG